MTWVASVSYPPLPFLRRLASTSINWVDPDLRTPVLPQKLLPSIREFAGPRYAGLLSFFHLPYRSHIIIPAPSWLGKLAAIIIVLLCMSRLYFT